MMWVTDALGKRRISQTNGGTGRHHWRWDAGWNPIAEYEDANATWWPTTKVKANIPGLAEKNELTGVYRYYSTDLLGSVRRMRNDAKASLATYEYEPYGGAYYNSGIALNVGFTGHQWDPNMGLYFAPYRWYNPSAARWLTRDPVLYKDGQNIYGYVGDSPAVYRDEFGLSRSSLAKKTKEDCKKLIDDRIKHLRPLAKGYDDCEIKDDVETHVGAPPWRLGLESRLWEDSYLIRRLQTSVG